MQTNQPKFGTAQLGETIAAAYDTSSAVASNPTTAGELAARRLERVLARGANARLVAALRDLADELTPVRARPVRQDRRLAA